MAVTIGELVKNPNKIRRIARDRRTPCEGGCGRLVWGELCRKCYRRQAREVRRKRKV